MEGKVKVTRAEQGTEYRDGENNMSRGLLKSIGGERSYTYYLVIKCGVREVVSFNCLSYGSVIKSANLIKN